MKMLCMKDMVNFENNILKMTNWP